MPSGGVVRVVGRAEPGRWVLSVEDQGPGVDPEVRARLFGAFVTSKPKGLGVGLFLSRRLVEANGGELSLDEACEDGARFVVSWPLTTSAAPAPEDACRES
jgi:two-component system sensor kinase FixL